MAIDNEIGLAGKPGRYVRKGELPMVDGKRPSTYTDTNDGKELLGTEFALSGRKKKRVLAYGSITPLRKQRGSRIGLDPILGVRVKG